MMTKQFHNKYVYSRRMLRLAEILAEFISNDGKAILDVGCGDGKIDSYLLENDNELSIKGIDVLLRESTYIEVMEYDGYHIPMRDKSVDTIMLVDVLHHTDDPEKLLKEVTRVASKYILIKDHVLTGVISYIKLRLMDYVGNAHYHVRLPYNYLRVDEWKGIFKRCNLKLERFERDLNLYTGINHLLFDSNLHFVARLKISYEDGNVD